LKISEKNRNLLAKRLESSVTSSQTFFADRSHEFLNRSRDKQIYDSFQCLAVSESRKGMCRMWTTLLRKSCFEASRLYDKFFALGEGGLEAVRELGREIVTFYLPEKTAKKKQRTLLPAYEVLETRVVPMDTIATAVLPSNDPHHLGLVPFGETQVDVNLGAVRVEQALHFDLDGCGCQSLDDSPALIYNSVTTAVQPVFQITVVPNPLLVIPTAINARLTWAGGTPQNWVTLTPANSVPLPEMFAVLAA
jgi:hypothetical protein